MDKKSVKKVQEETIDWAIAKVTELNDIRSAFLDIYGYTLEKRGDYFPDLVAMKLKKEKDNDLKLIQANLDLVRAGKNQEKWETQVYLLKEEIEILKEEIMELKFIIEDKEKQEINYEFKDE